MRRIFELLPVSGRACWMLVAVAAVVISWSGDREISPALAQSSVSAPGSGGLISHFHEDPNSGVTRVIMVDPLQKSMAVYHVAVESGAIQLKSVRSLTIDFQVQDYNSGDPSPIDMKKTLQRN